ncbi:MAG: RluA family pseudouridine synthase [Salibacteraceae bacterium]
MKKNNTDHFNPIDQRILYEDNHLIIINKQAGELVQGDRTKDKPLVDLVKAFIKTRDQKPGEVFVGIPHRIDRPVSGAVVYAKTSKGLSRMSDLFRRKAMKKTYWAIVEQAPEKKEGRLEGWMKKNEKQNKSYVSDEEKPEHKIAILHYKLLATSDRYYLLEIDLETGRHHQIRAQLAHMGCIIKGDLKYGAARSNPDASISLHARKVEFMHPIKNKELAIVAPCPSDALWQFFETTTQ